MKSKIVALPVMTTLIAALAFLYCGDLQDPWADPENAKIRDDRSLTSLPSRINMYQEYPCSLFVMLPGLADSIAVVIGHSGGDTVLWRLGPLTAADTAIAFSLVFPAGVQSPLKVYLYRQNGNVDSLIKTAQFRHPPEATPASTSYTTYINMPSTVAFTLSDPDGDLRACHIWIDSTSGQAIVPPLNRTGTGATVSYAVSSPSFDTLMVLAQAFDSTGNASALTRCTVFVLDTVTPRLTLIRLSPSINDSIVNKLPCSLLVKVLDDSPIDSAVYAINPLLTRPMAMINDTVALAVIAELDSGANYYEAQAWDRAGNHGKLRIPIHYTGSTGFKFTFSNIIDRTINENGTFLSINLDNSITLDPPPVGVPNWKADVTWQIQETKPDSGIRVTLNPTTRVVSFAVVDSEWNGSEAFTFIANWNDAATGSAFAIYTVLPVNDAPVIKLKAITKVAKRAFDTVWADTCVKDPDHIPTSLSWTQDTSWGKIYTLLWLSRLVIGAPEAMAPSATIIDPGTIFIDLWKRRWAIVPKNSRTMFLVGSTYTDTLRLIARDPLGASDTQNVIIRATY
ncbi:MAG: hypothetical protein JXA71_15570 [Chitinispirillaceae bacterium]|nr:hypothetical protein [Chitinispirillaceae bacterium]